MSDPLNDTTSQYDPGDDNDVQQFTFGPYRVKLTRWQRFKRWLQWA